MKRLLFVILFLCQSLILSAQTSTATAVANQGPTIVQHVVAVSRGAGTVSDMDISPTAKGSILIAMPMQLSPGIKVLNVTDDAPGGSNIYKQLPGSVSSCAKQSMEIWYCESCKEGVTELKFHLSAHVRGSINALLEVSGLASPAVPDGKGAQISDGVASKTGSLVGPSIKTTTTDFVIDRYFTDPPLPTAVTPPIWTYNTSYTYGLSFSPDTYQPTLTGGKPASNFCMSMAAFRVADSITTAERQ
jgi:hypothetical protein